MAYTNSFSLALWMLAAFAAALVINYLADRLFQERPQWGPVCPRCGTRLTWSTYALGLRPCPRCGWRWRPWIVVAVMLGGTWLLARQPPQLGFIPAWGFLIYTVLNTVLDLEHRVLSPPVELVATLLALGFGIWRRGLLPTLTGMLAGMSIMGAMYLLGRWMTPRLVQQNMADPKEPVLGFGDVLLTTVMGAFLGWPAVLSALILGALAGGFWALVWLIYTRLRYRQRPGPAYMPYAPFLLLGVWATLFLAR